MSNLSTIILRRHLGFLLYGATTKGGCLQRNRIVVFVALLCVLISSPMYAQEQKAATSTPESIQAREPPSWASNPCEFPSDDLKNIEQAKDGTPTGNGTENQPIKNLNDQFDDLRRNRSIIQQAVETCSKKIRDLSDLMQHASTRKNWYVDDINIMQQEATDFNNHKNNKNPAYYNEIKRRIEEANKAIPQLENQLKDNENQKKAAVSAHSFYQRPLNEIDNKVNQLFSTSDAENSFKLQMSITFACLVGVVIIGFFIIAWRNPDVTRTIFSNEAGIQFITLFAIVIAVILFGIIKVLEGKELSALLGGLSGYILGRSRDSREGNGNQESRESAGKADKAEKAEKTGNEDAAQKERPEEGASVGGQNNATITRQAPDPAA